VLDGGAKERNIVKTLTVRHLALSANCIFLTRDLMLVNIRLHFIDTEANPNGFNIKKVIDKQLNELITSLDSHADAIIVKFTAIIVDSVQQAI